MKKIVLSLALLAGLTSAAHAQTGVKYGIKGGYNLATFSGTDSNGSKYKSGFAAGGFLNFGVSDMFSIQPELLYSQKGASIDKFQGNGTTTFKSTLGYLDVPIMFRVNAGDDGKGLFFELGPQGSFVLHNRDFTQTGNTSTQSTDNTSTDDLNKVVIGYAAGLGYQLTSGLSLGIRYTGDFSQVYKDGVSKNYVSSATNGLNGINPSVHNSVFQFQVGYAFGGK
ncbi:porin family protein [Hymenobacter terricola]|uniref:porin family protein n=1 Tax=Hymenobacter terricola TaxID=2819236 RepID=UPI001B314E20|nr:porin family protein [Hymenobacter terricola]